MAIFRTPLKVIFTGVPDAGKSTLIGRILCETNSVFEDQVQGDLAHYTDGLKSEQEEGRTIDVSYRTVILPNQYRAILIDTPGHGELLTNFVSGVSGADVCLALTAYAQHPQEPTTHIRIAEDFGVPVIPVTTRAVSGLSGYAVDSITGYGIQRLMSLLELGAMLEGSDRRKFFETCRDDLFAKELT